MIHLHARSGPSFARLRIGLMGGSFNPSHEGHLAMSLYALKRMGFHQIWWLVSPQNPLKLTAGMAPLAERLEQAKELAKHPKIIVTDIEKELGTRYTVDTLRALRMRFPTTHFVWLIGADNFEQLPKWRLWPQIFEQVPIAVFRRSGHEASGEAAIRFAGARRPASFARKLAYATPPAWLVLDNPLNLLSGTSIRRARTIETEKPVAWPKVSVKIKVRSNRRKSAALPKKRA